MQTLARLSEYTFTAKHLGIFRQLGEKRACQRQMLRQQPDVLDTLRQTALLESVEYSSHLDGVMVSRQAVKQLALKVAKPKTPVERQIAGYTDGLVLAMEPAPQMTVSVGLIRQLHALLYGHLPHEGGRWRVTNKKIVERSAEGNIVGTLYRTVATGDIDQYMMDTVGLFHTGLKGGIDPVLLISSTVLDFLCVHPFSDGNGRMSRLIMLLMLSHCDYHVGQFISLERLLAEHEENYNDALRLSVKGWHDGRHDPIPWMTFFAEVLLIAYEELAQRIAALCVNGARAPKTQLIQTVIEQQSGLFSVADICIKLPTVSREMVKKVIQHYRDEGKLKAEGRGRGAQWLKV